MYIVTNYFDYLLKYFNNDFNSGLSEKEVFKEKVKHNRGKTMCASLKETVYQITF